MTSIMISNEEMQDKPGKRVLRAGEGVIRNVEWTSRGFLMIPHPLTNFEIQRCYQNEPRFNDVYWRGNLPKIK